MERIEYDPEIDPSIREAKEAAERERELAARIRSEIERYVADHDLIPRTQAELDALTPPPWDEGPDAEGDSVPKTRRARVRAAKESARRAKEVARRAEEEAKRVARELRSEQVAAATAGGKRAAKSLFTGTALQSEWMRKMWPYLLGIAVVLVLYIGYNFQVQQLHLERRNLERDVRELSIKSVERTAERVRATRRSAIVERLKKKNIPLEEFSHPVKRIER